MYYIFSSALSNAAFTPHVIIPGVPTAGDYFNIICRLDGVVERLAEGPAAVSLQFVNSPGGVDGDMFQNGLTYTKPHILIPVTTDDAGTYRCRAVVDVTINDTFISSAIGNLLMRSNNCTLS